MNNMIKYCEILWELGAVASNCVPFNLALHEDSATVFCVAL